MKLSTVIALAAAAGLALVAASRFGRRNRPLEITTEDLSYQEHSPQELASENLLDLNTASQADFQLLGLDCETCDRIVENRPYRSKLDLISRMVIPQQLYNAIRHQVGVARATESIKFAG
jgi:DNA uptake protein ComE-like DNA-binding protein